MAKTKILIVEDDGISAWHIETYLKSLGYEVVGITATGQQTIQHIEQSAPDLVLMDIGLPGEIDGIVVAEQIQSKWGLPVVFLSAHSDDITLQRARATQPYGFVIKPFEERELRITLEMALSNYHLNRELRESAARLEQIFTQIPFPVDVSAPDGAMVMVNQAFLSTFGIPSASMVLGQHNPLRACANLAGKGWEDEIHRVSQGENIIIPSIEINFDQLFDVYQSKSKGKGLFDVTIFPIFRDTGEIWHVGTIWKAVIA